MKFHPLADLFPDMSKDEFATLVADIKANGLLEPISTYQGEIIDGKHRFKACDLAKVKPKFVEYKGDNPLAYVISRNIKRRHLTLAAKASVADKLATLPNGLHLDASSPRRSMTVDDAAKEVGVSATAITRFRAVREHGSPELMADIVSGLLTLEAGAVIAKKLAKEDQSDPKKRKRIINAIKKRKRPDPNYEAPLNSFAWANANKQLRQKWIDAVGVKSIYEAMTDEQKDAFIEMDNAAVEATRSGNGQSVHG